MAEAQQVDMDEIDKNIKAELNKEPAPQEPEPQEPEWTDIELQALEHGWNPDGKDKDGNTLSADAWMARKPLFNSINTLKGKISEMDKTIKGLQEHNRITADKARAERDRLMGELKQAKEKAYEDMDVDEARKIDEKIEALRDEPEPPKSAYTEQDWNDSYARFTSENPIFEQDEGLKAAAINAGQVYISQHPDASPQQVYDHVIETAKSWFPEKFEQRKRPTTVGTTTTRTKPASGSKKRTLADIPEEHRDMAKVIIASGVSEEEYCKQYFIDE